MSVCMLVDLTIKLQKGFNVSSFMLGEIPLFYNNKVILYIKQYIATRLISTYFIVYIIYMNTRSDNLRGSHLYIFLFKTRID